MGYYMLSQSSLTNASPSLEINRHMLPAELTSKIPLSGGSWTVFLGEEKGRLEENIILQLLRWLPKERNFRDTELKEW